MKALSIVRHAKAKGPEGYPSDQERPLTKSGRKDAALLGALLAELQPPIDWVISSPALRTRETTENLTGAFSYTRAVVWEESIYEAYADTLLMTLRDVPAEMEHVVLVGHNPGVEELVSGLCAGSPSRLNLRMSTGALAYLQLEIFWWNQIRWGCGQLQLLLDPKALRKK